MDREIYHLWKKSLDALDKRPCLLIADQSVWLLIVATNRMWVSTVPCVYMGVYVLQMEDHKQGKWKFAGWVNGAPYAIMCGVVMMLELCANNLATQDTVCHHVKIFINNNSCKNHYACQE